MSDDQFPVFGADGKLLGNLTGNYGQQPSTNFDDVFSAFNPLPALPSTFAPSSTSQGTAIASSGGTSTGGNVAGSGGNAGAALTTPQATAAPTAGAATTSSGVVTGGIADYFLRGVIIILGFIFVAIGLNMFRPGTVPNPANLVRGRQ